MNRNSADQLHRVLSNRLQNFISVQAVDKRKESFLGPTKSYSKRLYHIRQSDRRSKLRIKAPEVAKLPISHNNLNSQPKKKKMFREQTSVAPTTLNLF